MSAAPAPQRPQRGFGGNRRGGPRRNARGNEEKAWRPVTKLGRLVQAGKISSLEEIYAHSLPIKETQIIDKFIPVIKDQVMKIKPVQKQTSAGQRNRYRAVVIVGDENGHIGLGVKTSKEVATAIRTAIGIAKLNIIPIRRGYWGSLIGEPHTVATKVTGKCGSVTVRLVPAPRGKGLIASPALRQLLQFAGVEDCYTTSVGSTRTTENTLKAAFIAIGNTYGFITPNLWDKNPVYVSPLDEFHIEASGKGRKGRY